MASAFNPLGSYSSTAIYLLFIIKVFISVSVPTRGVHISMGKFQSGFLKKHIIFPGCILFPESKYVRVEHFDPGK